MKKLLTIMVLALALCLVCGAALADLYEGTFDSPAAFEAALAAHAKVTSTEVQMNESSDWAAIKPTAASYDHKDGWADVHVTGINKYAKEETVVVKVKMHAKGAKDDKASKVPTCQEDGYDIFKCTVEGCTETTKVTLPKNTSGHNWVTTVTDATCEAKGKVVTKCSYCDAELTSYEIPQLDHKFELKPTAPTCDEKTKLILDNGAYDTVCSLCGKTAKALGAAPANVLYKGTSYAAPAPLQKDKMSLADYNTLMAGFGVATPLTAKECHKFGEKENTAPTCDRRSGVQQICQRCGAIEFTPGDKDDRLAAEFVVDWTATAKAGYSCAPGKQNVIVYCKLCGGTATDTRTTDKDGNVITKKNHTRHPSPVTVKEYKEIKQKIGANEYTLRVNYNGIMGTEENEYHVKFQFAQEHKFTKKAAGQLDYSKLTAAQKCVTDQYTKYECSICGELDATAYCYLLTKKAAGHKFGDWKIDKQIGEDITWKRECSVCKAFETKYSKTKPIDPCADDAHVWGYAEGEEDKLICGKEVEVKKVCTVCGAEKTFKETRAHKEKVLLLTPATCKEDGEKIATCEYCGLTLITVLKKEDVAHTPDEPIVTPATTEAEGSKVIKCKVCGETISTEVLPKLVPEAKYTLTAEYAGSTVKGKLTHVEGTQEAAVKNIRVTFYIEGGYYMATMAEVDADGNFTVDGVGPITYITVAANGGKSVNPEDYKAIADPIEIVVAK